VTPLDTYLIQSFTRFTIQIKTIDPIPWASQIQVQFPASITLASGPCKLISASSIVNLACSCLVQLNTLILTNPFSQAAGYDPRTDGSIQLAFDTGGVSPATSCDAGAFIVSTFAIYGGVNYAIDYYSFQHPWDYLPRYTPYVPIAWPLQVVMLPPSSYVAYNSPTTYTMKVTPALSIPKGSYIAMTFPPAINLNTSTINCQV